MELIITNLIGMGVGLLTSWIFWKWQLNVKPNLKVSKFAIYDSHAQTFKVKIKNEGSRDITDISADFKISQRKKGQKSGDYFVQKLEGLSEHASYRQVLSPATENKPWGLLNSCVFESDSSEQTLDSLTEEVAGIERRLVVDIASVDAQSGSKLVIRKTYSIDNIVIDKQFSSGLTVNE